MTNTNNDILVVITARGGSKGIPMKNIKSLNGKPLIQYSIELAVSLFQKEQIVVSTDHKEIQIVAQNCGIPTPALRPSYLAQDNTSTYEVLLDILKQKKSEGFYYKRLLLLQPTSPFRKLKHIEDVIKLDKPGIDMVVSVKETKSNPYFNLFEENEFGNLIISKKSEVSGRQYAPKVYEFNGSIYLMKTLSLEQNKISDFKTITKYVMEDSESIDLDTQLDWDYAEFILKQKND